ncbi:MAG: MBL fold metallo-hydrolase [Chloracidobacterium sp.]|nr:MBL fold metallo-hydrolase [Chloracidobacterium sp.]
MKKWVLRSALALALLVAVLFGAAFWSDSDSQVFSGYRANEGLRTVKDGWPGTPVDHEGRFINHEFPFLPKSLDLLKWQLGTNKFAEEKERDNGRLEVRAPSPLLSNREDGIVWLGHATFLIRLNGVTMITDPAFGNPPFIDRYVDVPSPIDLIPDVDLVLISHDHRDHMDEASIRSLMERFPDAIILAGLGSEDLLGSWSEGRDRVRTAGWFQKFETGTEAEVFFVPVRHWSRRGLFDTNKRLWGGFVIRSGETSIYFGGDSGYGRHYRETGEVFPEIDYFLIGIGSYEPRWFMEPNHNNPSDVIKAFRDIGARTLVPMHYATFNMSDEPPSQPLKFLRSEAEAAGLTEKLRVLAINEGIEINDRE